MSLYKSLIFISLQLHIVSNSSIFQLSDISYFFPCMSAASYFILFILSILFWREYFDHCILICFLLCNNHKYSSSNYGRCCRISYRPRLTTAEILIMFSQAIFMSSLNLKFSKAANLIEILIVQCPNRAVSLGEPTVDVVRPILNFSQSQGTNGSDSQVGGFAVTQVSRELKDSFGFSE